MAEGGLDMDDFKPPDIDPYAEAETSFSVGNVDDMSVLRPLSNPRTRLIVIE